MQTIGPSIGIGSFFPRRCLPLRGLRDTHAQHGRRVARKHHQRFSDAEGTDIAGGVHGLRRPVARIPALLLYPHTPKNSTEH